MDTYGFAGQFLHGFFQALLNGRAVVLALPAHKRLAVILDGQFPPGHGAVSTLPMGSWKPRRKAAPSTAALPGRCTRVKRTAPEAHAIVRLASSRVPGAVPATPEASSAPRTLIR